MKKLTIKALKNYGIRFGDVKKVIELLKLAGLAEYILNSEVEDKNHENHEQWSKKVFNFALRLCLDKMPQDKGVLILERFCLGFGNYHFGLSNVRVSSQINTVIRLYNDLCDNKKIFEIGLDKVDVNETYKLLERKLKTKLTYIGQVKMFSSPTIYNLFEDENTGIILSVSGNVNKRKDVPQISEGHMDCYAGIIVPSLELTYSLCEYLDKHVGMCADEIDMFYNGFGGVSYKDLATRKQVTEKQAEKINNAAGYSKVSMFERLLIKTPKILQS